MFVPAYEVNPIFYERVQNEISQFEKITESRYGLLSNKQYFIVVYSNTTKVGSKTDELVDVYQLHVFYKHKNTDLTPFTVIKEEFLNPDNREKRWKEIEKEIKIEHEKTSKLRRTQSAMELSSTENRKSIFSDIPTFLRNSRKRMSVRLSEGKEKLSSHIRSLSQTRSDKSDKYDEDSRSEILPQHAEKQNKTNLRRTQSVSNTSNDGRKLFFNNNFIRNNAARLSKEFKRKFSKSPSSKRRLSKEDISGPIPIHHVAGGLSQNSQIHENIGRYKTNQKPINKFEKNHQITIDETISERHTSTVATMIDEFENNRNNQRKWIPNETIDLDMY